MRLRSLPLLVALAVASCSKPVPQPTDPQDAKSPAPADYRLPPTGVLSLLDLSNFAKQERDFVKPDDFSKGFDDSPLKGRLFAVEIPAPSYGGSSVTQVSWSYDADKTMLSVTVDPGAPVQSKTDFGPKKKMSNAFGAEIEVDTMETWQIELGAEYEKPLGVFPTVDPLYSLTGTSHGPLIWTARLPPEQARRLTANLQLRLEGKVVATEQGQTVSCGTETRSATFTSPTESTTHNCIVYVRYSRVALVTKDGRVLHE